ncbi:MAG: aKG-HExxH-type peptide beta-hydroxylase [Candidatus Sulfotelmatobacter sp.]
MPDVESSPVWSSLKGILPFPNLSDWAADGALYALQALKYKLGSAPDPTGHQFLNTVLALEPISWQSVLLHPAVFAFLAEEPERWRWQQLLDEVAHDGAAISICDGRPSVWTSPSPRFERLLRLLGRGSRGRDCAKASFVPPTSPAFERYVARTRAAIELMASLTPGFVTDLRTTVHAVAFVDDKASFRGSSGAIQRGLVLLSPDDSWDVCVFAEELLHEATHNLLDLMSLREPLLAGTGAFEERYSSPFRPDPRHLYGNFHALVVVARLLWLFRALEQRGIGEATRWRERRIDYATRASDSLGAVRQYGGLSANARVLLDRLVVPTLSRFRDN